MKQYKILADFGQNKRIGTVLTTNRLGKMSYFYKNDCVSLSPHEIAILCKLGFLEEVGEEKEWSPWDLKNGDEYWITDNLGASGLYWSDDVINHFFRGAGLIFRTKEEAQAKYEEIISKGRVDN